MPTSKTIHFTHRELLELICIVRCHREVAEIKNNAEEAAYMNELLNALEGFHVDENGAYVTLENMTRFSLWLCVETYVNFCKETKQLNELTVAISIYEKLQG